MFGSDTFIVHIAKDAMAMRVLVGDYLWMDPDESGSADRLAIRRLDIPTTTP